MTWLFFLFFFLQYKFSISHASIFIILRFIFTSITLPMFCHSTNVWHLLPKKYNTCNPSEQFLLAQMSSSALFCFCFPASAVIACLHTLRGQMAEEKAFSHQSVGTTGLSHQSRERQFIFPFLVSFRLLCDGRLKGNQQLILAELAALGSSHSWREDTKDFMGKFPLIAKGQSKWGEITSYFGVVPWDSPDVLHHVWWGASSEQIVFQVEPLSSKVTLMGFHYSIISHWWVSIWLLKIIRELHHLKGYCTKGSTCRPIFKPGRLRNQTHRYMWQT